MKFSEIIGSGFFNIQLESTEAELLDAHLLAANHHYWQIANAKDRESVLFHKRWFLKNVREFHSIISMGDFSQIRPHQVVIDYSFHKPESWVSKLPPQTEDTLDLDLSVMCQKFMYDPDLFMNMKPDVRWGVGESHPFDAVLFGSPLSDIKSTVAA